MEERMFEEGESVVIADPGASGLSARFRDKEVVITRALYHYHFRYDGMLWGLYEHSLYRRGPW